MEILVVNECIDELLAIPFLHLLTVSAVKEQQQEQRSAAYFEADVATPAQVLHVVLPGDLFQRFLLLEFGALVFLLIALDFCSFRSNFRFNFMKIQAGLDVEALEVVLREFSFIWSILHYNW